MIRQALAIAAFAAFLPSTGRAFEAPPACSVTISYSAVGGSIDTTLAQKIDRQFRHDPRIVKREKRARGHGSYDLCLVVKPPTKSRTVYRAIRALMPATSVKAATTLTYAGKGRYVTKFKPPKD